MYVAPTAPHAPATPAERHQDAFTEKEEAPRPPSFDEEDVSDKPSRVRGLERISDKEASNIDARSQKRLRSMLAVDEMVASLVQELEEAGKLDNTFIFFTSDNGLELGEHRIRGGKNQPYEESAHVPLFVRGPGVPARSKIEKLALNTDLAPTFAALAGVKFPADGRSLAPLLGGEQPSTWRSAILLEKLEKPKSSEEESGKGKGKGKAADPPDYQAVRTETHKYVEYDNGERELYDLEADPYELESLHESADLSLLENLKTKLDTLKSCSEEGCREAENTP